MASKIQLKEIVEIARNNLDPRRFPTQTFDLLSIPAYDNGMTPEVCEGNSIGSNKTVVASNDVLFSKLNPRIPRVWLVKDSSGNKQICSTEFLPIRVKDGKEVEPEYLRFMFLAPQFLSPIQAAVNSSTKSHQRVKPNVILEQSVPLPSLKEQRLIVNRIKECLSRVDEIKSLREGALREAQALENALLNEIEAGLSAIQEPLDHVVLSTRNGFSLHAAEQDYNGFVLTLTAVRTFNLDLKQCKPAQLNEERVAKYGVRLGDVFISRSNTPALVGLAAIVTEQPPERMIHSDLLIKITPNPQKVLSQYLTIALRFPLVRKQIQSYARGTSQSMVKISGESLRKVQIPLPNLDEQNQVIHRVNRLQQSALALINSLETEFINYLPQAVLRKAFAGEL
jgi:type I restriction enzyme S subunit